MDFNKSKFSELLMLAKGKRSINNYALTSDVDSAYISRLLRCLVDKPPSATIINKLAAKAHNGITSNDLMAAAGYLDENSSSNSIPDWATSKDKRDFKKWLESPEVLYFDGIELSDEDRAKMLGVMETIFWDAKKKNKEAYRKSRGK